jgi:hypothetical protein
MTPDACVHSYQTGETDGSDAGGERARAPDNLQLKPDGETVPERSSTLTFVRRAACDAAELNKESGDFECPVDARRVSSTTTTGLGTPTMIAIARDLMILTTALLGGMRASVEAGILSPRRWTPTRTSAGPTSGPL